MNELVVLWDILNTYPTCIPFYAFAFLFMLLLISMFTGVGSDIEFSLGDISEIYVSAGVSKVPLIIGLFLTSLAMTLITLVIDYTFLDSLNTFSQTSNALVYYSVTFLYLVVCFFVSIYIAGFVCKPIAKLLQMGEPKHIQYVGQTATVISMVLNESHGEVKLIYDGFEHQISAYSNEEIGYGKKVVIAEYNSTRNKYFVIKLEK